MKIITSLKHAARGIGIAVVRENNVRLQLTAVFLVIMAGLYFKISSSDWLAISLVSGLVIALELINTTLEKLLDLIKPRLMAQAAIIKDIAAGAVLVSTLTALIVASFVFIPHLIQRW